jgi:host factor-I protein
MNIQDAFLNQARLQKIPLTVYLAGGHQIRGILCGFDQFSLLIGAEKGQNLVYKHAVSSIVPSKEIDLK